MILGHNEIHNRLTTGQIFKKGSWEPRCVKEASYVLRVADDGLMLDGERYRPGKESIMTDIVIKPGKIAILSTMERMNMPSNLLGKIGIRFDYACQGLTGLMGIQVDPFYGWGHDDERLYIRVANLGNDAITIPLYAGAFTFELHSVSGYVPVPKKARDLMWLRIQDTLSEQRDASWSYVTQVQSDSDKALSEVRSQLSEHRDSLDERLSSEATSLKDSLSSETESIRQHLQPVVMFGIFLVAVTILGVVLSIVLNVSRAESVDVPTWVVTAGWILLLLTLSVACITTTLMGRVMIGRLWKG